MASNGVYPKLAPTIFAGGPDNSRSILASSVSSLSSSTSARQQSPISKIYRQASTLFLTRRLPEALTTLLSLIEPPGAGDNVEPAPVALASKTTRVKVWSLYLTILNAVVELEQEEGKDAFGAQEWRALCNKVRDSAVWEEVVRKGYHGVEGDVDADVVINLATLLLAHARDQMPNQRRLETYLASCSLPNLDLSSRLGQSPSPGPRTNQRYRSPAKGPSGTSTPRDLNARIKLLELYTLHVLPRNSEWNYARDFIAASSVLDEERREAFMQALGSLEEEVAEQERQELEEQQRQEEQLRKDIEEAKRLRAENEDRERRRLEEERAKRERAASEVDYGVEQTPSVTDSTRSRQRHASPDAMRVARPPRSSISRANGKAGAPLSLTARASMIVTKLRALFNEIAGSLNTNPVLLMRFMAFVVGFVLMLGNKALRERIQRILAASWAKVKATAGMGTKISYI